MRRLLHDEQEIMPDLLTLPLEDRRWKWLNEMTLANFHAYGARVRAIGRELRAPALARQEFVEIAEVSAEGARRRRHLRP